MPKIAVGTFNVENLFLRYRLLDRERGARFPKNVDKKKFLKQGGSILMLGVRLEEFGPVGTAARDLTAKVILANEPDVLALQEVETLEALKLFNRYYLKRRYPYQMLVDGNDPRQIDVGVISKYPVVNVMTHQFEPPDAAPSGRIFSRDCLEVDIDLGTPEPLTLLVNHFKSKIGGGEERRQQQATRVAQIVKGRFGPTLRGRFIICGDLNAHFDAPELKPLLTLKGLVNVVPTYLPVDECWTHYYKKTKAAETLDHLVLSPALAKANPHPKVSIERRGLGTDITYYQGPRFGALSGKQGASDHCPIFVELTV